MERNRPQVHRHPPRFLPGHVLAALNPVHAASFLHCSIRQIGRPNFFLSFFESFLVGKRLIPCARSWAHTSNKQAIMKTFASILALACTCAFGAMAQDASAPAAAPCPCPQKASCDKSRCGEKTCNEPSSKCGKKKDCKKSCTPCGKKPAPAPAPDQPAPAPAPAN